MSDYCLWEMWDFVAPNNLQVTLILIISVSIIIIIIIIESLLLHLNEHRYNDLLPNCRSVPKMLDRSLCSMLGC